MGLIGYFRVLKALISLFLLSVCINYVHNKNGEVLAEMQVQIQIQIQIPDSNLELLCIRHLDAALFCKNHAKLYFDAKHLENGLKGGVKIFGYFLSKKVRLLVNIRHCPSFVDKALVAVKTSFRQRLNYFKMTLRFCKLFKNTSLSLCHFGTYNRE